MKDLRYYSHLKDFRYKGQFVSKSSKIEYVQQNYRRDSKGFLKRPDGKRATKKEIEIYRSPKPKVKEKFYPKGLEVYRGKQLKRRYAHYYKFVCKVRKNARTPKTFVPEKGYYIVKHDYAYSSNAEYPSKSLVIKRHNNAYPNHEVIECTYNYTKVMML